MWCSFSNNKTHDEVIFLDALLKSNATDTNYFTTFLQTADVANSY